MSRPTTQPQSWSRDKFFISTSQSLIQPQAINAALDSDFMYWAKPMSEEALTNMLANSLCFGLYETCGSSTSGNGEGEALSESTLGAHTQIGFARLITDRTTFAYLTDVYVLPSHQHRGLGTWLVSCVQETLDSWPDLRGSLLFADEGRAVDIYGKLMGVKPWVQGKHHLIICQRTFGASALSSD